MATSNAERFLGVSEELALEMATGLVYDPFWEETILFNAVEGDEGIGGNALPNEFVMSKRVTAGNSWQFIMHADSVEPETHTPGTELLGQTFAYTEGSLTIDSIIVAHREIPLDHVQKSHFDVVGPELRSMGRALARNMDQRGFVIAAKSALAASVTHAASGLTVHNGGNVVERVGAGPTAAYPVSSVGAKNFRDDVTELAYEMDIDYVPDANRKLVITPYIQQVLQQDDKIWDADFNHGRGDMANRVIGRMAGFDVVAKRTTHIPSTNITAASLGGNLPSKYHHDFTYNGGGDGQPVALAFAGADENKAGLGYIAATHPKLGPIYTVMIFDERRNTLFLKSQLMIGWNQLYPPCAGAIIVDDA